MTSFSTLVLLALASSAIFAAPMNERGKKPDVTPTEEPPIETSGLSASELVEIANANLTNIENGIIVNGDVAVRSTQSNADPCTAYGCTWPKGNNGMVEIPYKLSTDFSRKEKRAIMSVLEAFPFETCVSFVRAKRRTTDVLLFIRSSGCWSYVGRQGGVQEVSIGNGCFHTQTIQHEVLHALGFNHEHSRSDRDDYVDVLFDNILSGYENNFQKISTNNLGTPYDYQSVMQYSSTAFSKDGVLETIVPITPVDQFGKATEMSDNDFERINVLYECVP